ncbi:hypothetical protein FK268_00750 [Tsukamurella sputi]|uniref:Uncharacterized protein n=1 Tax=Tsukamurella sputi TaxID=2591848 RepID=A0A5C5RUH1_9ACTN|nr:hypothetical protein [Tsukamurella sputi]TWS25835.1 hypothetical protein FK268_00750 [Tsukamurella sputi]
MSTWEELQRTSITEVRRRAAIVDTWNDIEPVEVPGGKRFAWNDGGGQAAGWFFAADGRVLLLTYEHESTLNFYDGDFAEQRAVFGGVPEDLVAMVANQPENYEFLNVSDNEGASLPHASGVFWFDGAQWHVAPGLIEYCTTHDIPLFTSDGFAFDVGFDYALAAYRFGQEFTPESLIAEQVANGYYQEPGEKETALGLLRTVFAEYDAAPR